MTAENVDIPNLLKDLAAQPPERRLEFLAQHGDVEKLLLALCDEARSHAKAGISSAVKSAEVLLQLADSSDSPVSKARTRRIAASALGNAGRLNEAMRLCDEGIAFAEQSNQVIEAGRLRLISMQSLCELGHFDKAIAEGERAYTCFEAANASPLAARAEMNLGTVLQRAGRPKEALQRFDRARPLVQNDLIFTGQLESNRGEALFALNEFEPAENAFEQALTCFESAGVQWASAVVEGNLADLATRRGRLQHAMTHFEHARRWLEQDTLTGHWTRIRAEQAESMLILGMTQDAIEQFQQVIPELEQIGLALETARARSGLGLALLQVQRVEEAGAVLAAASNEFVSCGNCTAAARVDILRAEAALAQNDDQTAGELLHEAIDVLRDRPADAILAHRLLARLAIRNGRLDDAERQLTGAMTTATEIDHPPHLANLLHLRAEIHRRQDRVVEAVNDMRAAIAQIERVRDSLQAERFRTAFLGDRLAVYEDLVKLLLDQEHPEALAEAFNLVERAKSRSLLELMRGAIDQAIESRRIEADDSEAELLGELQRLRAELNALYSRLGDDRGEPGTRRLAPNWHDMLLRREREFAELESRIATTRGIGSLFAPPVELEQARQQIPDDTLVIEYFVARDEVLAFVIGHDQRRVARRLFSAGDLDDTVWRLHFQINRALRPGALDGPRHDRLITDAVRELSGLGEAIVRPALRGADDVKRLLIVPHGRLHLIPFHALHVDGEPLIEQFEVCTSPSLSVLSHLVEEPIGSHSLRPLVIGVADDFAPRITDEAQFVAALLGTRNGQLLMNGDATCERVCASLADAGLIHIACHGRFSTDMPFGSGLRMADRWLTVREICGLRLNPQLLVLSGCETGRSLVQAGDEMVGLQRSFFVAGVPRMLVSLWRVDDETGTDFMRTFYSSWNHSSEGPVDGLACSAFRDAVREVRRDKPHPAFWAPFTLVGRP